MSNRPLNAAQRAGVVSLACLALVLTAGFAARGSELQATEDFADVAKAVGRYVATYGAEHVLLVMDIDNTVMSMETDLGSDHWFEWQSYLLKKEPTSPHLVAKTFAELLKVQGILYDRGKMRPTQQEEPKLIADLQKQGVAAILLTSRGSVFREPTLRELARCGYDFKASALPVRDLPEGEYLPYDSEHPEKSNLSVEDLKNYKLLNKPNPVLYTNGVFMTAGQHKGMMLMTLLKKSPRDIKAIVYLDDNVRHVGAVFSAAVARNIEISSFHYQYEDDRVKRFQYGDKANMDAEWAAIRDGGKVVAVAKPPVEKPTLQVERAPSHTREPASRRRWRLFHGCW
jgi:Protein of unknown function (DUF2608)